MGPLRFHSLVRTVATTEVRRSWRGENSDRWLALGAIFAFFTLGMGWSAGYGLGRAVRAGDLGTVPSSIRLAPLGVLAYGSLMIAQRTIKQTGALDASEGVLTATTPSVLAMGKMTAEWLRLSMLVGVPGAAAVLGFAIGARDPLGGAVLGIVALAFLFLVVSVGFALGTAAKAITTHSGSVARHRGKVSFVLSIGLLTGYLVVMNGDTVPAILGPLAASPLGWLPELALAGASGWSPPVVRVSGGATVLFSGITLSSLAVTRLAPRVWLAASARPTRVSTGSRVADVDRLFAGVLSMQSRAVARKSWLRAVRSPFHLQYAFIPFFFVFAFAVESWLTHGALQPWTVWAVGMAGALATGGAFTLNPIGGEGDLLPATLLAVPDGRTFLTGLVVAGWLLIGPLTIVLIAVAGLLAGMGPISIGTVILGSAVLAIPAPGIAAGVGVHVPNFEKTRVRGGHETVVPSAMGFVVYAAFLTVAGLIVWLFPWLVPTSSVSAPLASLGGILLGGLVAGVAGWVGFRHATATFDGYYPPATSL